MSRACKIKPTSQLVGLETIRSTGLFTHVNDGKKVAYATSTVNYGSVAKALLQCNGLKAPL